MRMLARVTALDRRDGRNLSRRDALLVTMAAASVGCRRPRQGIATGSSEGAAARPWGGLQVARVSGMNEDDRGGDAVVVLHGWGAPGNDLVPFAQALKRPGVRFFVPAGPLHEMGGGRAWWHLDPTTRQPHALTDEPPASIQPNPDVLAARAA